MRHAMIIIACLIPLAQAPSPAMAQGETAEQRCENIAQYAEKVAQQRDKGVKLTDVKEATAERVEKALLPAYDHTASIVYRQGGIRPADARKAILEGCLEGLK